MSKIVKTLTESELIDLIEGIVEEAIVERLANEKTKWLAENKVKANAILVEKIEKLQATVNSFLKG